MTFISKYSTSILPLSYDSILNDTFQILPEKIFTENNGCNLSPILYVNHQSYTSINRFLLPARH